MWRRRQPALLLVCLLSGCGDPGNAVRTWVGCLERAAPAPPVRACGEITLRGTLRDTANFMAQVRHTIPLERLTRNPGVRWPGEGVAHRSGDGWRLQLGTPQPRFLGQFAEAADNGAFELNLAVHGDSLLGSWVRTCFAGCQEFGSVALRRVGPRR